MELSSVELALLNRTCGKLLSDGLDNQSSHIQAVISRGLQRRMLSSEKSIQLIAQREVLEAEKNGCCASPPSLRLPLEEQNDGFYHKAYAARAQWTLTWASLSWL
ncbi:hypothetical protein AOLI_G00093440 [Acnodon oligacanthus]